MKDFANSEMSREEALASGSVGGAVANTDGVFTLAQPLGTKTVTAPYPRVNEGDPYHLDIFYFPQNGTPSNISAKSENVEAALAWLNYGYTKDGAAVRNYGERGVSWDWGEDGKPKYKDEILNQTEIPLSDAEDVFRLHGFWSSYRVGDDVGMIRNVKNPETWDYRAKWGIGDDPTTDNAYALPTLSFTPEESEELGKLMTEINTYGEEMAMRFITGETSLDEYDAFVERLNELGMQRVIEIYQKGFDAFLVK